MNREQIKAIALQHGFTLRENDDLRPYVYGFAEALIAAAMDELRTQQKPAWWVLPEEAGPTFWEGRYPGEDGAIPLFRHPIPPAPSAATVAYLNTNAHLEARLAESQAREVKLRESLAWYQGEAEAIAKNLAEESYQAVLASLTVLRLDHGRRAYYALSLSHDNDALRERLAAERERIAKWFDKRAEDYAAEYGHDDMGAMSFGSGHRGEVRQDYHSELLENAEAIRAMKDDDK